MKSREQLQDELLVLRCQQRDATSFDELVGRWQLRLWRYAYQLTGREDVAWDMVQETWAAVVKGISDLEDVASFPRWIYQILNNRCADSMRKQVRERRLLNRLASEASPAADLRRELREPTDELEAAISQLPAEQRSLLALRYVEGFSVRDIGTVLEISEGTVKSRLFHAKQKLKGIIERAQQRNG